MSGEFGIVHKGYITHQYNDEVVAIKTCKGLNNRVLVVPVAIMVASYNRD